LGCGGGVWGGGSKKGGESGKREKLEECEERKEKWRCGKKINLMATLVEKIHVTFSISFVKEVDEQ